MPSCRFQATGLRPVRMALCPDGVSKQTGRRWSAWGGWASGGAHASAHQLCGPGQLTSSLLSLSFFVCKVGSRVESGLPQKTSPRERHVNDSILFRKRSQETQVGGWEARQAGSSRGHLEFGAAGEQGTV